MKNFASKTLNLILNIVMIFSVFYAIFNLVMMCLPAETQEAVYEFLNMSSEYIATFSVSAVINAGVLVATKVWQTYSRIKLTEQLTKSDMVNVNTISVNEKVIKKTNEVINNLNVLEELTNALLSVQKVTTERNIKASDKLVYADEKAAYKQALVEIENAKAKLAEVDNVATVIEKTEVKEVEVVKEVDENSGRV